MTDNGGVAQNGGAAQLTARLLAMVGEITEGAIRPPEGQTGAGSIRRLGLNSVAMLNFLVAVEDEFGIEWDDDVDESVLDSFDAVAAHILAERA
jgi:acyl carrier protein